MIEKVNTTSTARDIVTTAHLRLVGSSTNRRSPQPPGSAQKQHGLIGGAETGPSQGLPY